MTPNSARSSPRYRVGISGWRYPPWRGVFYPPGLRQRDELRYAASTLNSIEINGTFYALQRPENFRAWAAETPDDFVFAVKGPRFVTHMKKLADVDVPLANFVASGLLALGPKLGPILWQLPPTLGFDADRLAAFFDRLPRDTAAASRLARRHDARVTGRAVLKANVDQPIRHAIEVRHSSFATPAFLDLLRTHDVAVVVADTAGKWPLLRERTSDFVYARLHGDVELYASGYSDASLDEWATWLRAQRSDAYVYFDNDVKVRAPFDAQALAARLAQPPLM